MIKRLINKIWVQSPNEIAKERAWIQKQVGKIGEQKLSELAKTASEARKNAYEPYSKYSVGASILTIDGRVFSSCNAEAVSYTETDHAERSAITKAISEGVEKSQGRKFIRAIAVSHSGESGPCGGCRQRIIEHADNCVVMDVDEKGNVVRISSLQILLPYSFNPSHLGL